MNADERRARVLNVGYLRRSAFLCGCVVLLSTMAGCQTQGVETQTYAGKPANQRYDLTEVEKRLDQLQPGMGKIDVLLLLGSPAIEEPDRWIYLPSRTGTIIPAEAVRVDFQGPRYTGWKKQPIILGERVTN
jgi:outer membrane protein assembly factor BamE (lipoprotein component of BamABCDE complex)